MLNSPFADPVSLAGQRKSFHKMVTTRARSRRNRPATSIDIFSKAGHLRNPLKTSDISSSHASPTHRQYLHHASRPFHGKGVHFDDEFIPVLPATPLSSRAFLPTIRSSSDSPPPLKRRRSVEEVVARKASHARLGNLNNPTSPGRHRSPGRFESPLVFDRTRVNLAKALVMIEVTWQMTRNDPSLAYESQMLAQLACNLTSKQRRASASEMRSVSPRTKA